MLTLQTTGPQNRGSSSLCRGQSVYFRPPTLTRENDVLPKILRVLFSLNVLKMLIVKFSLTSYWISWEPCLSDELWSTDPKTKLESTFPRSGWTLEVNPFFFFFNNFPFSSILHCRKNYLFHCSILLVTIVYQLNSSCMSTLII